MISTLALGCPSTALRNTLRCTCRGATCLRNSSNLSSASAARPCCVARSISNLWTCTAWVLLMRLPTTRAKAPATTDIPTATMLIISRSNLYDSNDMESHLERILEMTAFIVAVAVLVCCVAVALFLYRQMLSHKKGLDKNGQAMGRIVPVRFAPDDLRA